MLKVNKDQKQQIKVDQDPGIYWWIVIFQSFHNFYLFHLINPDPTISDSCHWLHFISSSFCQIYLLIPSFPYPHILLFYNPLSSTEVNFSSPNCFYLTLCSNDVRGFWYPF